MSAERILVIDAGTSSLRAVAVSASGETSVIATEAWDMRTPADAEPFGRELDGPAIEGSLGTLLRAAGRTGAWSGVAFAGQREGVVFVDEGGAAVCVSPNVDARASAEGMALDAAHGREVYLATGHLPSLMQAPVKYAWLRRHRPAGAARVRRVLPLADWLASLVTREAVASRSLAAENGLLDVRTGAPPAYLDDTGVPPAILAPVVEDGTVVARVRGGDLAGTPAVLAGADTQCALVGLGAVAAGDCGVPAGWSAPLQLVTSQPVFDEEMRTWTGPHVAPGRFVLESNAGEAGRAWVWACGLANVAVADAEGLARATPPGSHDVMAVLGPRVMRASRMSAGLGALTLPLPLVMSSPDAGDMLRAVLESMAYALRANLEQIEAVADTSIASLRLGGGLSRNATFAQILADVADRAIEVSGAPETTALGAAVLASVALGLHASLDDAVGAMCRGRRTVRPGLAASAAYEDYYGRWCAMADALERMAAEGA
ncbi:MAG: FGGY-family carbohydrate kinase [Chloroflexota bacterium]|nr:FGGY-family carbohydrate kinase [Chloroflexota bacterium]